MGGYHHGARAVWDIKYYLVWITKYRYKVLRGEIVEPARDLRRKLGVRRDWRASCRQADELSYLTTSGVR